MLAIVLNMLRIGGEAVLSTPRQMRCMFLTELSTAHVFQIEQLARNVKVRSTVKQRSCIKTRSSKLAPSTEIKGQSYSAAVEPSNPRRVKTNWLKSTSNDLDMNLPSVTRLENRQQGFMETWIGFGQRITEYWSLGMCLVKHLCISTAGKEQSIV